MLFYWGRVVGRNAAFYLILYYINYGHKKSRQVLHGQRLLLISIIMMAMTTIYFPWNDLQRINDILAFMIMNICFPWRLLGMSTLFLTTLSLFIIKAFDEVETAKGNQVFMIILAFAVISSGYFVGRLTNDEQTYLCAKFG